MTFKHALSCAGVLWLLTAFVLVGAEPIEQIDPELKSVSDLVTHLEAYAMFYRIRNGAYPIHWSQLKEVEGAIPAGATITNIEGVPHLTHNGWYYVILVRNIYNDRYDPREALGIVAFQVNPNTASNYVYCSDYIVGAFYKKFAEGVKIAVTKFCGVNGKSGVAGWTHVPIVENRLQDRK